MHRDVKALRRRQNLVLHAGSVLKFAKYGYLCYVWELCFRQTLMTKAQSANDLKSKSCD